MFILRFDFMPNLVAAGTATFLKAQGTYEIMFRL